MFVYTACAAPNTPIWFPARYVATDTPATLDITTLVQPGDVIASATVAVAPSGAGELVISAFTGTGYDLIVTPTSGQPGRVYTYEFVITMTDGKVSTFRVQQGTLKLLPTDCAQVAPVAGFGMPVTATSFGPALQVATGLIGQGTGQLSSLLLPAYLNEITTALPGAFILNPFTPDGNTVVVQDNDPVNNAKVWPPLGAQINALGVNVPFYVSSLGGRISFTPSAGATQWTAG